MQSFGMHTHRIECKYAERKDLMRRHKTNSGEKAQPDKCAEQPCFTHDRPFYTLFYLLSFYILLPSHIHHLKATYLRIPNNMILNVSHQQHCEI